MSIILAQLITRYGVGNGYLILLLARDIPSLVMTPIGCFQGYLAAKHDGNQNFVVLAMVLVLAAFSYYLWRLIRRPPRFPFRTVIGKLAWFEVPPFPSSAVIEGFVLTCISTTGAYMSLANVPNTWMHEGWSHLWLELAMMVLLGILCYNWFWGIDLFGIQVADLPRYLTKRESLLNRQFGSTLPLLLFGAALFWVPVGPENFQSLYWIINFTYIIWLMGLAQDFLAQWQFWKVNGPGIELMVLDNMALASYLKGFLENEKVPCHFQGYHFRLLVLWLKPLFKVRLLVPEDHRERALQLIAQVPYQVA